ncbi:MAG: hypothetical protein RI575_03020, partial [Balneolaceae bacterium]|nr:hypothetical protein [Balneolaceae bacterium]
MGKEFEYMLPAGFDPFSWYADEAKDKLFEPIGGLQPGEFLGILTDQIPIKVGNDPRQNHKGRVLREERTGQPRPAKIV